MISQRIPGIIKIGYLKSSQLPPDIMLQSIAGLVIGIPTQITWIPFVGECFLSWEGSLLNGGRQEKSTLKFNTCSVIPDDIHLAFVVRCASGKEYVIGAREARYPVVTYSETTGKQSGDAAVRSYTITHIAQKSVLECAL